MSFHQILWPLVTYGDLLSSGGLLLLEVGIEFGVTLLKWFASILEVQANINLFRLKSEISIDITSVSVVTGK